MRLRRTQWRHARNTRRAPANAPTRLASLVRFAASSPPSNFLAVIGRRRFALAPVLSRHASGARSATSRSHGRLGRPGVQQQRALC